jgi:hypothetical protein
MASSLHVVCRVVSGLAQERQGACRGVGVIVSEGCLRCVAIVELAPECFHGGRMAERGWVTAAKCRVCVWIIIN